MPFKPGKKKTGGRKAGTPNKPTAELREALTELGIDPTAQLAEVLSQLEPKDKANVLVRLMAFIFPQRKAIEAAVAVENSPEAPRKVSLSEAAMYTLIARGDDTLTLGRVRELLRHNFPDEPKDGDK